MDLWIAGAGGAALEAWAVIDALRGRPDAPRLKGFLTLDGTASLPLDGLSCMQEAEFLATMAPAGVQLVLAVGAPGLRQALAETFAKAGFSFATLIHPAAVIGRAVRIGPGSIVMAGAVLETQLDIGRHCLINVLASVAHECQVGDFCNLGPGVRLAGRVVIGERSDLGGGCVFRPGVRLGPDMVVGCGAVVVGDWPGNLMITRNPAKSIPVQANW